MKEIFFFINNFFFFFYLLIIIIIIIIIFFFFFLMYVTNICRNYSAKQRVNAKLNCIFYMLSLYVCCILLLCWYTCNQSYIEQFFNLHISTLHPSAISSISFKNQVNMKYMQSVFPLLPFHIMKMSRHN